jgi:hypothetical protein
LETLGGISIQEKEKVLVQLDFVMNGGDILSDIRSRFFIISIQKICDYSVLVYVRVPEQLGSKV